MKKTKEQLEIMTGALIVKCRGQESKEAIGNEIMEFTDNVVKLFALPHVRFQLPSAKDLIEIAILFNDGKLEQDKLADMVGMCEFVVDRLYENGDVTKRCSKEGN